MIIVDLRTETVLCEQGVRWFRIQRKQIDAGLNRHLGRRDAKLIEPFRRALAFLHGASRSSCDDQAR